MQPHGVRLDPAKREELARRAYALHQEGYSRVEIEAELDVSAPTVRNLINYGRRITVSVTECKSGTNNA